MQILTYQLYGEVALINNPQLALTNSSSHQKLNAVLIGLTN